MGHSPLQGVERAPTGAPGHDTASLGPSGTSDSGSDMTGLEQLDDNDPGLAADLGAAEDVERPQTGGETIAPGVDTDEVGTGERMTAGNDAPDREAADLMPDRVVSVGGAELDDDVQAALADAAAEGADDEDEDDEDEDDEEDENLDEDEERGKGPSSEGDDTVLLPR